jgi:hypothetical protein
MVSVLVMGSTLKVKVVTSSNIGKFVDLRIWLGQGYFKKITIFYKVRSKVVEIEESIGTINFL